ncbi:hypothetical protein ES703_92937 [subsurface metagenome]
MAVPGDWDFSYPDWELNTDFYTSAPSSIRIEGNDTDPRGIVALCKKAASLDLPQGRIVTQARRGFRARPAFYFRNQAAFGSSNNANTYRLYLYDTTFLLQRIVAGVQTALDTWGGSWWTQDAWHLIRLTWWVAYNKQNVASLAIRLEYWDGANWIINRTYYDTANRWETSGINRCGPGTHSSPGRFTYFDDTEIWAPSE